MSSRGGLLGHPFWQAILLLFGSYAFFRWGITYIPPLFGVRSAPVPQSVVVQYTLTVLVGILVYVSDNEERWRQFKQPVLATLVDPGRRQLRLALLILIPALVGFVAYDQARPKVTAPAQLRSIHPAPPSQITFRGTTMSIVGLENPLRTRGEMDDHMRVGRRVYVQNCVACHGDRLDGDGHYAQAFSPPPLSFTDPGTIAQLEESFVFWRIAKGGPGLPREGTPWDSAMPAWEDILAEDEIWAVIIYLYEQTGWRPRRWEAH